MKALKKGIMGLLALVLIVGLFAGCGGTQQAAQDKTTAMATAENSKSTEQTQPKSSTPRVLKLVLPLPTSLDPQIWTWGTHHDRMGIFEGLTKLDSNLKPVPANAEKWTHNSDYTVWTFTLRKDIKWSDGSPLNAHDYEYSIKRAIDPKTYAGKSGAFITGVPITNAEECKKGQATVDQIGVKALDDYTLEITLSRPSTMLDTSMSESWALPVPQKVVEAKGADWSLPGNIISNGPYMVKAFDPNTNLTLVKNPNYYGTVNLDEVDVLKTDNQLVPYQNGDLNVASLQPADLDMVNKDANLSKQVQMYKTGIVYFMDLLMSENDVLQKNIKLRQAISMSIDKDLIAKNIMKDTVRPGYSLVPEIWASWGNDIGLKYDQAKAKQLMEEAGYPNGQGLTPMTIFIAGAPTGRELAIADQITKGTGIKVNLVNEEWAKFVTEYQKVQPKEIWGYYISGFGTPYASYMGYIAENQWNVAKNELDAAAMKQLMAINDDKSIDPGKKNDMKTQLIDQKTTEAGKKYLSLIRQAITVTDPKQQEDLYKQAAVLREQEAITIALDWENGVKLVKPEVKGYVGNALLLGAPPLYYNDLAIEK